MTETKLTKKERLLNRKKQIDKQLRDIEAKERAEKKKIETRLKIIVGGTALNHMTHSKEFRKAMMKLIEKYGRKQDKDYLAKHSTLLGFNLAASRD